MDVLLVALEVGLQKILNFVFLFHVLQMDTLELLVLARVQLGTVDQLPILMVS